jgi:hypothetical protein
MMLAAFVFRATAVHYTHPPQISQSPSDSSRTYSYIGPLIYWVNISATEADYPSTLRIETSQIKRTRPRPINPPVNEVIVEYHDGSIELDDLSLTLTLGDTSLVRLSADSLIPMRTGKTYLHVRVDSRETTVPIVIKKRRHRLYIERVLQDF